MRSIVITPPAGSLSIGTGEDTKPMVRMTPVRVWVLPFLLEPVDFPVPYRIQPVGANGINGPPVVQLLAHDQPAERGHFRL